MTIIRKEIPVWDIDWVNKTFLLNDTPEFIDDLWIDWAIYTAFSFTWNQITLTDAPDLSIMVDYVTANTTIPVTTTKTLWQILTKIWDLTWQTSKSTNFSRPILVDEINETLRQVLRGRVSSILSPGKIYRAWELWFLEWRTNVRVKWGWIATEILNIWDTELKTDTNDLLESWYVEIGWDILAYTWKTDTELVWVTGQTIKHYVWEKITQLYVMPAEMEKPKLVNYINKNSTTNKIPVPLFTWYEAKSYNVIKTWTVTLLEIAGFEADDIIEVNYNKVFNDLSEDTDICPIPDDYWTSVIARLVAWAIAYDKEMPQAERVLNRWYWNLQNMFQYFTNKKIVIKQKLKPTPYSFSSIK